MIPWPGDIVRLNPAGAKHLLQVKAIKNPGQIASIYVDQVCKDEVLVDISGYFISLIFPDGRFYAEPPGTPPLFEFVSGPDSCEVKNGTTIPVPVPGNYFESSTRKGKIIPCDCYKDNADYWPNGRMLCGAHIEGANSIAYATNEYAFGWTQDGILYREQKVVRIFSSAELKKLNTDGRNTCAGCGNNLKCPAGLGLNYRHCPYCEP